MMKLVYSPRCLEYEQVGHPENPKRINKAMEFLADNSYDILRPEICTESDLELAHTEEHIRRVKQSDFFDPDTPNYPQIYELAKLSAGAAIKAAEENAFSVMRPPGHHAGKNFLGGFCYFNNIAVAVKKTDKKTLIVDIDRHHGNGTQDIFEGDDMVDFVSLHSAGFPGTGTRSVNNCRNEMLSGRTSDEEYLKRLEQNLDYNKDYEQIAVSAGFDTHKEDPFGIGLSTKCYEQIAEKINEFKAPVFCVLEGGYNSNVLGESIQSFIKGLER